MVNGVHTRLDVIKKDVFVRNIDVTDAGESGFFTESAFGGEVHVHVVNENECEGKMGGADRAVNFNYYTEHKYDQWAIWVEDGVEDGILLGLALPDGFPPRPEPMVPRHQIACYVYVKTIKTKPNINKTGGISAIDTVIPVVSTSGYRQSGGKLRIENEIIIYSGISDNSFIGCIRGADGTTAIQHANETNVSKFSNATDKIKNVFAHEAGHFVNLLHTDITDENILSPIEFGTTLGDGFWDTFIGKKPEKSALTGRFCLKLKEEVK